jgi:hypothetical protein
MHGIETLPACLRLAQVILGPKVTLSDLWVKNHHVRDPIRHDLDLVAGLSSTIKDYKRTRGDKASLECRIISRSGGEVSVLGYSTEAPIHRAYLEEPKFSIRYCQTIPPTTVEDPRTILSAIPGITSQEWCELRLWPSKAIIYDLDLAQGLIARHLAQLSEPQEILERPLYITRTSNIQWSNPEALFQPGSCMDLRIHPQVPMPSAEGGQSDSHSWLVELDLMSFRNNSSLKAEMIVVRTPEML